MWDGIPGNGENYRLLSDYSSNAGFIFFSEDHGARPAETWNMQLKNTVGSWQITAVYVDPTDTGWHMISGIIMGACRYLKLRWLQSRNSTTPLSIAS